VSKHVILELEFDRNNHFFSNFVSDHVYRSGAWLRFKFAGAIYFRPGIIHSDKRP
jgi:hypothetical protein